VKGIYTSPMNVLGLAQSDSWHPLVFLQGGVGLHHVQP